MADSDHLDSGQHRLPLTPIVCFFLAVTSILVPLRCYVRARILGKFAIDDWFTIIGQAFMVAGGAVTLAAVQSQLGEYLSSSSPNISDDLLQFIRINQIIYCLLNLCIHMAIGLMLVRILSCAGRTVTIVYIILAIACCNSLQFVILTAVEISRIGTLSEQHHEKAFQIVCYVNAAVNMATEWSLVFVTLTLAYTFMKLRKKEIVAVALVLGTGGCASVAAFVRTAYLGKILNGHGDPRFLWGVFYMCSCIENGMAVAALCFATYRPLLAPIWRKLFGPTDELSGELMRKPSQTTYAGPMEHSGHALTRTNTHVGGVAEFSDVLLAQIEADYKDYNSKSPEIITPTCNTPTCATPTCEMSEEKAMNVHVEIKMLDVQTDSRKGSSSTS
ncbi:hypothetical protein K461DRAFT_268965 [Myriangium duriaei CBS 260.36]|uniref:Rhodopsin domain-containing protein n=1 Tax=Myriangium duriaei CBS 260.36 TaxID=1168546 RepID=A0A9P4J1S0_9PEZI|nr:hypothetical protein K461DRAFT_268965 [Myriangium duriaei CBS 260.36]